MSHFSWYADLKPHLSSGELLLDEPLKDYSFTKTGGRADLLVFPSSFSEVQQTVQYASEHDIPLTILGNGSNLIIKDGGIRGIVLNLTRLRSIRVNDLRVTAQCGAAIIDTSRLALSHSLSGLEFACGIPGSIGGALYMNAGAYGGEVSDILESALLIDRSGEFHTLSKDDLGLSYRSSVISQKNWIVLEATFTLQPGHSDAIAAKMAELTFLRESKQPLEYPSCGSVFKRPPNHFAGRLIQDSGLQGVQIGGAQVSTKHAGFIVNVGNASATDYIQLIEYVRRIVKERFDVELETEVKIIGEELSS